MNVLELKSMIENLEDNTEVMVLHNRTRGAVEQRGTSWEPIDGFLVNMEVVGSKLYLGVDA